MNFRDQYNNTAVPQQSYADVIPVLYAPFEKYITGIIPLMLEHVWQQKNINNSSAVEELLNSGWICRLITLDKRVLDPQRQMAIPHWARVRDDLIHSLDACKDEYQLAEMINYCMKLLMPVLKKRFKKNYRFPGKDFYCWWYTVHDDDTHLALHLINAYQPDSPFDHLDHFVKTMLQAIEQAVAAHPDITIVSCGSWLNNLPNFQQLWPESFKYNQKIINETGGFGPGAWGQYMTSDGGYNEKKAAVLKSTGKHPFALTEARCVPEELTAHLKKIIPATLSKRNDA
jgi:hypothetical protein